MMLVYFILELENFFQQKKNDNDENHNDRQINTRVGSVQLGTHWTGLDVLANGDAIHDRGGGLG
jgi:hypothetical protein